MYENLERELNNCPEAEYGCSLCEYKNHLHCRETLMKQAADAIEERDKYALTIQHEMMAEAESHMAQVERLHKQIEELQKNVAYWQAQLTKSMCGETLAELERPRWIPVTERLPEDGERALVMRFDYVTNTPFYDLLWFDKGEWWNRRYTGDYAVTHWMPLPEPPKEEGE